MCYSLDNSRKFWTPDSKFSITDHQQALNQTSSIIDEDELGPKMVAMENGVYAIGLFPNSIHTSHLYLYEYIKRLKGRG